jgi:type IV pilus assembly protein PilC
LYFDDLFVNLVEAGEHAARSRRCSTKVATYKEKTEALKKKIKKALFYPGCSRRGCDHRHHRAADLRHPAVRVAVQGLRRRLAGVHADGHRLSSSCRTRAGGLRSSSAPALTPFFYFKNARGRCGRALDRMLLKAPVIGPILVKAAIARYARTLSTMFAAGVPLVEALTSVAGAPATSSTKRRR